MNPTPSDPVIDEIREVRHRISERFGHDPGSASSLLCGVPKAVSRSPDRDGEEF